MGLIKPKKNYLAPPPLNKRILGDIVIRKLNENYETPDGNQMSVAEAVVSRLVNTAVAAESNKDASTAAKLLFEYSMGKASVVEESGKEELPAVKITVSPESKEKLLELAQRTEFTEDVPEESKFIMETDDGARVEIYDSEDD